jgi:drug/metabolite transporter (DMT)-like permease
MSTQPPSRTFAPLAAVLTSVVLWASAFIGIRAAGRRLPPGPLGLGRLTIALLGLLVICAVRREPLPNRQALKMALMPLLICGVLWFGAYNLALNTAERHVDAGTAAMIVYISPVLIALLAGIFLGEELPRRLISGCAVSFAGVVVIALPNASHLAGARDVVLCLVAATTLAAGAVTQKIVLRSLSGLQTITLCCAIGVITLLPFAGTLVHDLRSASAETVAYTAYLGIFPTTIGFLTWAFALARTDAGRLGATTYLVPAVSIVLAWIWLSETPSPTALLGGALCLTGVAISRRRRPSQPRPVVAVSPAVAVEAEGPS